MISACKKIFEEDFYSNLCESRNINFIPTKKNKLFRSMYIMSTDIFWTEQPRILFNNKLALEVWPKPSMSSNQKLNALTRLIIYFIWRINS